jgi:hypothetical protein
MGLPVVGKAHEQGPSGAAFVWFIYGSSLDRDAFAAWAGEHGYRLPDFSQAVPARLKGYRLAFDVMSRFWGGAVASLVDDASTAVEGLALPMAGDAHGLVDHKEGAISGLYEAFAVTVEPLAGGASIPAVAYRAAAARRLPAEASPSARFVDVLVRGARASRLSDEWVHTLESLRDGPQP